MNSFDWRRARSALAATIVGLSVIASAAQEPERTHTLPFIPSASDTADRQGFVRVVSHSTEAGEVRIEAVDDEGETYGPVVLSIGAGATAHFNSDDLENGNAEKGLLDGVGPGEGNWRLQLSSELDIEVLSYVRTTDGFVTAMHDTVPSEGGRHRVAFFNPGSNTSQVSRLRLVNPGEEAAEVSIVGVDDRGESPGGEVTTTIPAGASRTFTAVELESGGEGLEGMLGDGEGKWRLVVESEQPVVAMNLLSDPMGGYLTNLSTAPGNEAGGVHFVPFMPDASDTLGRQGFVRVINHSTEPGDVRIDAVDDEGQSHGPVMLAIDAGEAVHFNSDDLESGNAAKGLPDGVGSGSGDWRLQLSSELDIEVLSYVRTTDGFVTAMHDTVPSEGGRHWVAFFNPGSNASQVSRLRLVNPGEDEAEVSIVGIDDRGESPGGEVTTTIPAGASRTFTAVELESGGEGLEGMLGDGAGKWRLTVESAQPLVVMSLLSDPMGHLTNLSTAPGRESQGPADLVVVSPSVNNSRLVAGATFTLSATVSNAGDAPSPATTLRYYRSTDATITATDRALATDVVAGLAASGSASASVVLTAPSTPATYYYGACVDAVAGESDATNNCSTSVEVDVRESEPESQRHPDLTVPGVWLASLNPFDRPLFRLAAKARNDGDGASPAATLRYYRSTDAAITTSDTPVGTDAVDALAASGSRTVVSEELIAPWTPGTHYFGACVDAVADESDTTNNCSAPVEFPVPAPQRHPDLTVKVLKYGSNPEAPFVLLAAVRNGGDGPSLPTTVRYYRSTDAAITTSDTPLGTEAIRWLAASATGGGVKTLTAPSTPATYYYGACVDAVANESDTTNNCSSSVEVTVPGSEQGGPDLTVHGVWLEPPNPSDRPLFRLGAKVRNDGDGESQVTTLRYYHSTDAAITTSDTEVGRDTVAGLAASGSADESVELTAPSTPGTHYYGACVDAVADESDTTNNCSASVEFIVPAPQRHPDLTVSEVWKVASTPEAPFVLLAEVRNDGDGASLPTTLRYYRSTDAAITTSDTPVGTVAVRWLPASATALRVETLTAPSTPATYYYGACVDAVANESDTTNNCSESVQVNVETPPRRAATVEVTAPK